MTRVRQRVIIDPTHAALQPTITILQMLTPMPYTQRVRVLQTILKFFAIEIDEELLHE